MPRPRTPSNLSDSLHHQLNSYALAASAAGVGLMALAPPAEFMLPAGAALASLLAFSETAEAKIVYTPVHKNLLCQHHSTSSFRCRGTLTLDLNHDGQPDFLIKCYSQGSGGGLKVDPANKKNEILRANSGYSNNFWASALSHGAVIKWGEDIRRGFARMFGWDQSTGNTSSGGPWADVKRRYLGLKIFVRGKVHYGWARLNTYPDVWSRSNYATLTGYAYETIPGKPIIAGKTHGKDVVTLEPASLGHLARGASAIPAWRGNQ